VSWTNPDEQRLFWTQDRMHAPEPVTPADAVIWVQSYGGINAAAEHYELPIRVHCRCINSYVYMAVAPNVPPDQMEAQGKRADERMKDAMGRLDPLWSDEWLPEIKSHLAWWAAFDLRGASTPSLVSHLNETMARLERIWQLHFRIVLPVYMAMSQFDELYRDLFGRDNAFDAFKLLQGFENKTVEAGHALAALARKARADNGLQALFQRNEPSAVMQALAATNQGRAFQNDIREYLEQWGQRGDKWGVGYPSWIEDPTPVFRMLKDYIAAADSGSDIDHEKLAADRDRAVSAANERLKGYPEPVREEFAFLLKAAQTGSLLSEDHGYWIDFCAMYRARCVFMDCGRRLTEAGVLADPQDVFYLTVDELLDLDGLTQQPALGRALVNERKAERERCRGLNAPPVLGTDYGPPPDSPMNRFFAKFFGGPPPASDAPNVLKGYAGAPGKVTGTARVIQSLDEAGRLQRGDILVTATTAPPWTPLFATAAAIVTDTGGILSHCAVVAREYRIPAVVGTARATAMIRDGSLIEVDGDTGTIRMM
jgi:pyruvate,water dikinase